MSSGLAALLAAHRLLWESEHSHWRCTCEKYVDETLWPGFDGKSWDTHIELAVQEQFVLIPHSRMTFRVLTELLMGYKHYNPNNGWTFHTRDAVRALTSYLKTGTRDDD